MKKEKANFVYVGRGTFDPTVNVFPPEQIEKKKDKEVILPRIEELKKELKIKTKKSKKKIQEEHQNKVKRLFEQFMFIRDLKFEFEKNEIYPKDVPYPTIHFIQYAEPHILYTDLYEKPQDWYGIRRFIEEFAEQSFVSYEMGMWLASISSAINCCEYVLKYEYLRILPKEDAKTLSLERNYTLGYFLRNDNDALEKLKIKEEFYEKIDYINIIRTTLYHFNPKKFEKVQNKAKIEAEQTGSLDSDMTTSIFAYRVYIIMIEILNHFYSKEKQLEYILECRKDWQKKRGVQDE